MNVFFGIGRLTADPIIGVTSGTGTSVARYTLAIPRCRGGRTANHRLHPLQSVRQER